MSRKLYVIILCVLLAVFVGASGAVAQPAVGPPADTLPSWQLVADGQPAAWPLQQAYPLDSLRQAARRTLKALRRKGHYFARLDSARVDTSLAPPEARLFVSQGPAVKVGAISLEGVQALDAQALRRLMNTRPGQPLQPRVLEADLSAILSRYDDAGYPLAQVHVEGLALTQDDPPTLRLALRVDKGQQLRLKHVELTGAERTRPDYVARLARLQPGALLTGYEAAEIQQRLQETAFFDEVGMPELRVEDDGQAVLVVPVKEKPPGNFDLTLGYLPADQEGGGGTVIGSGHLVLRNLFGSGRIAALRLNKLPGEVRRARVRLADPFVFGLPFGVEGRFEGIQQDSTYGQQRYRAALDYRFTGHLKASVTLSREVTRPGQGSLRDDEDGGGGPAVPRSSAWFVGVGGQYQRLDNPVNPRRGLVVELDLERGRKERLAPADSGSVPLSQGRLTGRGRLFVPSFPRQVAVLGADARLLLSSTYDRSDLFRLGGATSLRGYDEDRFRGHTVGRALAEYRYQIDRRSFTYLFFDLGYVEAPEFIELARTLRPGYGFGIQFDTNIGLVNASYAMRPDVRPFSGRVHVGLSFGL